MGDVGEMCGDVAKLLWRACFNTKAAVWLSHWLRLKSRNFVQKSHSAPCARCAKGFPADPGCHGEGGGVGREGWVDGATSWGQFQFPIHLTCMFLSCERNPDHPERKSNFKCISSKKKITCHITHTHAPPLKCLYDKLRAYICGFPLRMPQWRKLHNYSSKKYKKYSARRWKIITIKKIKQYFVLEWIKGKTAIYLHGHLYLYIFMDIWIYSHRHIYTHLFNCMYVFCTSFIQANTLVYWHTGAKADANAGGSYSCTAMHGPALHSLAHDSLKHNIHKLLGWLGRKWHVIKRPRRRGGVKIFQDFSQDLLD